MLPFQEVEADGSVHLPTWILHPLIPFTCQTNRTTLTQVHLAHYHLTHHLSQLQDWGSCHCSHPCSNFWCHSEHVNMFMSSPLLASITEWKLLPLKQNNWTCHMSQTVIERLLTEATTQWKKKTVAGVTGFEFVIASKAAVLHLKCTADYLRRRSERRTAELTLTE